MIKMVRRISGGTLFTIGGILCMAGGCMLDSESLVIPACSILSGIVFGFLGYQIMGVKKW